jgi:hypothetical protein
LGDSVLPGTAGGLEGPTYFTDRSLGKYITPGALRCALMNVERYADHFVKEDEDDVVWIALAASRGWIALTKDGEIRINALERAAVVDYKAHLFTLTNSGVSGLVAAHTFIRARKRIEGLSLANTGRPLYGRIQLSGKIDVTRF